MRLDSQKFDDRDGDRYYGFASDDSDPCAEDRGADEVAQERIDAEEESQ
jgi:hypothetical protein